MAVSKEFLDEVGPYDRIRYRFVIDRGQVRDFLVQHETKVDGEYKPVARFDTSHGFPHRDILSPDGSVIEKQELPVHWSYKDCLAYAANDLRHNWEWYRDQFLERYG